MATAQYAPQLRPLSVGEVLDASFKVYRQAFGTLTLCVLVVAIPLSILTTLISASTDPNAFNLDVTSTSREESSLGLQVGGALLNGILSLVLFALASAACFRAVSGFYLGERVTWQESLRFASGRLVGLVVASMLITLALIPAFIALIVPGVWLMVAWSLTYPAMLSERLSPAAGMGRSFRLVKGRWWATLGALVVMYVLVLVLAGILGALVGVAAAVAAGDNEVVVALVLTVVNVVSYVITLPLFAAVITIIYFDLRVRKEGFDLQLLAQGVGESSGTSAESVASPGALGGEPAPPPTGEGFAPPVPPPRPGGEGSTPPAPDSGGTSS